MEKKIIVAIIAVLLVAAAGVYGYIKFVPSEDEIYSEQMNIVLNDMKVIKSNLNTINSSNSTNTSKISTKIDNTSETIDDAIKVLNDLDKSITNSTRKEYISLCNNDLKQTKTLINAKKDAIIIINDVNEEEMTLNEALSKMADLDKKINRTETKINSIEQEIKDYESKYSFVLVDGKSILPKKSKK